MTSFPGCSAFSLTADLFRSHFCWPRLLTAQLCATFVPPSGDNLFNNLVAHLVGYSGKAAALRKLDRPAEALADYDKALQLKPEDFFLRFFRAHTLQELRRDREATIAYEQAKQVAPHPSLVIHCILASILLKKEAPGDPNGVKPEQRPNAPLRRRRAKSREVVRDEETQGSNKDEAHS